MQRFSVFSLCWLFVRDGGTRRPRAAGSLVATKTHLPTPSVEVSTREIERVAKLDKHIERHHEAEGVARRSSSIRFSLILREKIRHRFGRTNVEISTLAPIRQQPIFDTIFKAKRRRGA